MPRRTEGQIEKRIQGNINIRKGRRMVDRIQ